MEPTYFFNNYTFTEEPNQLIIGKEKVGHGQVFSSLVQSTPCAALLKQYQIHLTSKLNELKLFNPDFRSEESAETFKLWKEKQIAKYEKKLEDPLKVLRAKVAKRCEQLFEENLERKLILGCMHVHEGVLKQTHSALHLPQFTSEKEHHIHADSVCVDWRASPNETFAFNMHYNTYRNPTFPPLSANGPDFSRRCFGTIESMKDLEQIQQVNHIHAERLPLLEKGLSHEPKVNNDALLQQILHALAPGGVFSFDLEVTAHLDLFDYRFRNNSPQEIRAVSDQIREEVVQDQELIATIEALMQTGQLPKNTWMRSTKAMAMEQIMDDKMFASIQQEHADIERQKAKEFTAENREKVLLNAESIFYIDGDIRFNLRELREGLANDQIERSILQKPVSRKEIQVQFSHRNSRSEENAAIWWAENTAIYRQLECYNALHIQPELNAELLPENKELLDEMLSVVAGIIGKQLEQRGFVNAKFDLNSVHPENGRLFSRIISAQKPD